MPSDLTTLFVDLDNTLHDYEKAASIARGALAAQIAEDHDLSAREVLAAYMGVAREKRLRARSVEEMRMDRLRRLGHRLHINLDLDRARKTLSASLVESVTPYHGAVQAIGILARRYRVIIITDGYLDVQKSIIAKIGIEPLVSDIFATYSRKLKKEDGSAYKAALREHQLSEREVIMIGDDWQVDILAAASVGLRQVWISHGRSSPNSLPPRFLGLVSEFSAVPGILRLSKVN
jgi:putative hydrolase of the HAD superfamily